jgi:hypothetical protein
MSIRGVILLFGITLTIQFVVNHRPTNTLTLYVDQNLGDDNHDCLGPKEQACQTIQGAINKTPRQIKNRVDILVGPGIYKPWILKDYTFSRDGLLMIKGSPKGNLRQFAP